MDNKTKILIGFGVVLTVLIAVLSVGGVPLLEKLGVLSEPKTQPKPQPKPQPVDCVYSGWSEWDGNCPTGPLGLPPSMITQNRSRTILKEAQNDGKVCDLSSLTESRDFNCDGVARDCQTGTYIGDWSPTLSDSCGTPGNRTGNTIQQSKTLTGNVTGLHGGNTGCPILPTSRTITCPTDCQISGYITSPNCPVNSYNKNIYQLTEPNITRFSANGGISCPSSTISRVICTGNYGQSIIPDITTNNFIQTNDYPNQPNKWVLSSITGTTYSISNNSITLTTPQNDGLYLVYVKKENNWLNYPRLRIMFSYKVLEKFGNNVIVQYGREGENYETAVTHSNITDNFIDVDITVDPTQVPIVFPFVFRVWYGKVELRDIRVYEDNEEKNNTFTMINNYNPVNIRNYGGVRRGLNKAQYSCPVGTNYSSGISQKLLNSNNNTTYLEKRGMSGTNFANTEFDVRNFELQNNCSNPAQNNGSPITGSTGYTANMGDLFGGSFGNIDCGSNSILTKLKVIPKPGDDPNKEYGFEYTCQPIKTNGSITQLKQGYLNTSLIYNDRLNLTCPVNTAISKITKQRDSNTDIIQYDNANVDTSNLIELTNLPDWQKSFPGYFDYPASYMFNNDSDIFIWDLSNNTGKYYRLDSDNNTITLTENPGTTVGIRRKDSINIVSPTSPTITYPHTLINYTCLSL
jgi:hypothetical protein